ncbi:hypothetical protein BHM03_00059933, partial [Ensete ventricosum]
MFCLSLIEHNLPLPPHLLNRPLLDAIKEELERLFLDKVQSCLGYLCSDHMLGRFFAESLKHPMPMVCIVCVTAYNPHLSLGFFDDIKVPAHLLPHKSR